ncbi:MAG: hypothetical protein WBG36_00170 [Ornithinimicrobium sp.]
MKVFVHIGSHKTGTTAIQHFAAAHRDELSAQGLLYPSFERLGRRPGRSHLSLVSGLESLGGPNTLTPEEGLAFLQSAREEARSSAKNVLFSAENIFRLKPHKRHHLFGVFRETFPDFEIVPVVALRRQDNLADSLYRNTVRSEADLSREPPTWPGLLVARMPLFDYSGIVQEAHRMLGGTPEVLAYAGHLRRNTVPEFFERLGASVEEPLDAARRVNVSYDFLDCHIKRHLFEAGGTRRLFRVLERFVRTYPIRSPYSFFSEAAREQLLTAYRAGNSALMADFPELENALADSIPADYPEAGDSRAAEAVGQRWEDFTSFLRERGVGSQLPPHSRRRDCVESFRVRQVAEEAELPLLAYIASADLAAYG